MPRRAELLAKLDSHSGVQRLRDQIERLVTKWLAPVLRRLSLGKAGSPHPKIFNDPIWGTIELMPWEVLLLDSPMVQRLRGVRQLGFAHLVYPGACHDRLEHVRGVIEASERMLNRLQRNADHRRNFGPSRDIAIPVIESEDRHVVRLAALLHDLGR